MSWDGFIQNINQGTNLEYAAIISKDGTILSSNFDLSKDESDNLIKVLENNEHNAGVIINNQQYVSINFDGDAWYLSKEGGGACIGLTAQTIIFGSFSQDINMNNGQPQNADETNKKILELRQYLLDNGS